MQQLAFLIPVLVVIWVMIIGIRFANYMEKKYGMNNPMPVLEKACPPHMWRWEEQPGMENTNFIRCQRCMRTPGQVSEGP